MIPDPLKAGGRYETVTEKIRRIDTAKQVIVLNKLVGKAGSYETMLSLLLLLHRHIIVHVVIPRKEALAMLIFSESLPFYKANFHCHTTESDGRLSPEECVHFYASAGYDILAITDHRTVTTPQLGTTSNRPFLIPGIEIDYRLPGQWVHVLGIGMDESISSIWNRYGTPQEGIDLIDSLGGIAILAHPAWSLNTPAFMRSLTGLSGVEIWNSVSTIPLNGDRADSSSLLDVTWASGGKLLPVYANDDSHQYQTEAGVAATMVQADSLSVPSIMSALKSGRFYGTTGPSIFQIENRNYQEIIVHCSPATAVIFYSDCPWAAGRTVLGNGITQANYFIQKSDHFVRVEVRDESGRKAWSAPIQIKQVRI